MSRYRLLPAPAQEAVLRDHGEGFRIVGRRGRQWDVRRLSRQAGQVWVPKAGWVRFRWSRAVPAGVKSYRVTRDRAGRWHVAFAAVPEPVPALEDLAAGHAVTARGGCRDTGPVNCEPQLLAP